MTNISFAVPSFIRGANFDHDGKWQDKSHSTKGHPPELKITHEYYDHIDTDDNEGSIVSGYVKLENTSDYISLANISIVIDIDVPGLFSVAFYDERDQSWYNGTTWQLPNTDTGVIASLAPKAKTSKMYYFWTLQKPANHTALAGDKAATITVSPAFTVSYPNSYPPFTDDFTVTVRASDAS